MKSGIIRKRYRAPSPLVFTPPSLPSQDLSILSSPGFRFLRELTELKTFANYATCDRSNLADWLGSLDPRFRQYTYGLVSCGLDRSLLHRVSEQQLLEDCGICLGVHRARILTAARGEPAHLGPHPCPSFGPSASPGVMKGDALWGLGASLWID